MVVPMVSASRGRRVVVLRCRLFQRQVFARQTACKSSIESSIDQSSVYRKERALRLRGRASRRADARDASRPKRIDRKDRAIGGDFICEPRAYRLTLSVVCILSSRYFLPTYTIVASYRETSRQTPRRSRSAAPFAEVLSRENETASGPKPSKRQPVTACHAIANNLCSSSILFHHVLQLAVKSDLFCRREASITKDAAASTTSRVVALARKS